MGPKFRQKGAKTQCLTVRSAPFSKLYRDEMVLRSGTFAQGSAVLRSEVGQGS